VLEEFARAGVTFCVAELHGIVVLHDGVLLVLEINFQVLLDVGDDLRLKCDGDLRCSIEEENALD
jgi:hypothetical protein